MTEGAFRRTVFLAGLLLAGGKSPAQETPLGRPNILVIVADDMGFSDAGCYGGEIATPNLDRLAAGGLRFTDFYNTGRCWPTRSSLLTGYYAQQIRMDPPRGRLPSWARPLPHHLKPLGYRCYHSGKWHVPGAPRVLADGGFDRSYKVDDHDRYFHPRAHTEDDRKKPPVEPGSGFYLTTAIADHALACLKDHAERHAAAPFFLYLAFTAPHFPLHAPPEDVARYRDRYLEGWDAVREKRWKRMREMGLVDCALPAREPGRVPSWNLKPETLAEKVGPAEVARAVAWEDLTPEQRRFQAAKMAVHAAMIDRMDREIGRVLEQVRAMGAWDRTVIFFLSDNGASAEQIVRGDGHDRSAEPGSAATFLCLGPGWSTAANTPFRLHKSWTHEGGVATPLVVHWPGGIAARGELRRDPGHVIDFFPTILELAGGRPEAEDPGAPRRPGRSLVPAFARDGSVCREWIFFHHLDNRALRCGNWKVVSDGPERWELYDLSADRCEQKDLAARHPDRVREMAALWERLEARFREEAGPPGGDPAK